MPPPLKERLRIVIGQDTVTIDEAILRLAARRWLPDCNDVEAAVSLALSLGTRDVFARVSYGTYTVRRPKPAPPPLRVALAPVIRLVPKPAPRRLVLGPPDDDDPEHSA